MKGPSSLSRVLVVEDDRTTFIGLSVLLRHYDYVVEGVGTVKEALARIATNPPNFLCLDLMLPDGDGIEVLSHVRLRNLPVRVAVLTANEETATLRKVRSLMPDLLMNKPIDFLTLLETIRGKPANAKAA